MLTPSAMIETLFVIAIVLAGLVTAPALAHALELPGKMRLSEAEYRVVQRVYYPGFTVAGIAELVAPLMVIVLLVLVPSGSSAFRLLLVALVGFAAVQAVFWLVTQPVNRHWVEGMKLGRAGGRFFSTGSSGHATPAFDALRARWEYSHVARALLAVVSLVAVASAAARFGDAAAAIC